MAKRGRRPYKFKPSDLTITLLHDHDWDVGQDVAWMAFLFHPSAKRRSPAYAELFVRGEFRKVARCQPLTVTRLQPGLWIAGPIPPDIQEIVAKMIQESIKRKPQFPQDYVFVGVDGAGDREQKDKQDVEP